MSSMTCDKCGKDAPLFMSTGNTQLCHDCAHAMGLSHRHTDMNIEDGTHALDGFTPQEEIIDHLMAYREAHP